MITKEIVIDIFEKVRNDGQWNIDGPLLYGYFFTDKDKSRLERAETELSRIGYDFVDIFEADLDDENEVPYFYLHVEKVETHSVESMNIRNIQLSDFSKKFALDSYDGFDVGEF